MNTYRLRKFHVLISGVLVALAATAACSSPVDYWVESAAEKVAERAVDSVLEDHLGVTIEGSLTGELPDGFPDIPLPPDRTGPVISVGEPGSQTWTLSYEVTGREEYDWMKTQLQQQGFTEEVSSALPGVQSTGYLKEPYYVLMSLILEEGEGVLQLIVHEGDY